MAKMVNDPFAMFYFNTKSQLNSDIGSWYNIKDFEKFCCSDMLLYIFGVKGILYV